MKYPKPFMKYVEAVVGKCLTLTNHAEYTASINYEEEPHSEDVKGSSIGAEIQCNSTYLFVNIWVYPCLLEDWERADYRALAHSISHEICHLFIEPVYEMFRGDLASAQAKESLERLERQTQRITNALFNSWPKNWYLPSKVLA